MKKKIRVIVIVVLSMVLLVGGFFGVTQYLFWYPSVPRIKQGVKHIACIGDSITYGAGVNYKLGTATYPEYLQELAGDTYQVLNYGLSGRTLLAEGDIPYTEEKFYDISLQAKADIYIIMLGTNDSKPFNWNAEKYEQELRSFLIEYKAAAGQQIYVMQPSKCFVTEGKSVVAFDIDNTVIENEIYDIVGRIAGELAVPVIDLYQFTESHPEWFDDGVHPNKEGNREIAEYIYKRINE